MRILSPGGRPAVSGKLAGRIINIHYILLHGRRMVTFD